MSRLQKAIVLVSVVAPLVLVAFRLGQLDAWSKEMVAWTPTEKVRVIR
jgi:hypothetical protein